MALLNSPINSHWKIYQEEKKDTFKKICEKGLQLNDTYFVNSLPILFLEKKMIVSSYVFFKIIQVSIIITNFYDM